VPQSTPESIDRLIDNYARVIEQRDAMLEVLTRIVEQFETTSDQDAVTIAYSQIEDARKAIKSVS
jgi:hypothetical protein